MSGMQPIQIHHEDYACRFRIRIAGGMRSGMPFVQHRHAHSHMREQRKERARSLCLHPFFPRGKKWQTDDDVIDASLVDKSRHVLDQCTDGRMTKSGESQRNSRRTLRIGDPRAPRTYVKRQNAHGRIERSVTFSARRCGDG